MNTATCVAALILATVTTLVLRAKHEDSWLKTKLLLVMIYLAFIVFGTP